MGAQGIHRRKRWRKLAEVGNMPPGDIRRLFGIFRWGAYSPAGSLERGGFFMRQLKRNGADGAWPFVAQAKWMFVLFLAAIAALALIGHFV